MFHQPFLHSSFQVSPCRAARSLSQLPAPVSTGIPAWPQMTAAMMTTVISHVPISCAVGHSWSSLASPSPQGRVPPPLTGTRRLTQQLVDAGVGASLRWPQLYLSGDEHGYLLFESLRDAARGDEDHKHHRALEH